MADQAAAASEDLDAHRKGIHDRRLGWSIVGVVIPGGKKRLEHVAGVVLGFAYHVHYRTPRFPQAGAGLHARKSAASGLPNPEHNGTPCEN